MGVRPQERGTGHAKAAQPKAQVHNVRCTAPAWGPSRWDVLIRRACGSLTEDSTMYNGHTVRVALIGVGNCASSLVQGVEFYRTAGEDEFVPGLMHVKLGGYHVLDVEFSAAFDVVEGKVGLDLSEAIFAPPNNTIRFAEVPKLNVRVDRVLTTLFRERGVRLDRTYQLNFGGNMDFYNMLERERLESKKISKTGAVTSQLDYELPADAVHVGPSDYVPWLTDRKWAYIRLEAT